MLSDLAISEYRHLRKLGRTAAEAYRAAKVRGSFREKDILGLVELSVETDYEKYDDSYVTDEAERRELWARIDNEGVYRIVVRYRVSTDLDWTDLDSVSGFIGDDWRNSGHDVALQQLALNMLVEHERIGYMPVQATREYVSCH